MTTPAKAPAKTDPVGKFLQGSKPPGGDGADAPAKPAAAATPTGSPTGTPATATAPTTEPKKSDANRSETTPANPPAEPGKGEPAKAEAADGKDGATAPQPGTKEWYEAEVEKKDKQYKNLQAHTSRVEANAKKLGDRVTELEKLVKGDEDEKKKETEEERKFREGLEAREAVSRKAAEEKLGTDKVHELLYAEESPFRKLVEVQPWLRMRLAHAEAPVLEALAILEEQDVLGTLGRSVQGIREKLGKELRDEHFKQFQQEVTAPGGNGKGGQPPSLSDVRDQSTRERKAESLFTGGLNLKKLNPHIRSGSA